MSLFLSTEGMLAALSVREQNITCRNLFWPVFGGCLSDFCLKKWFLLCVEGFVSGAWHWSP